MNKALALAPLLLLPMLLPSCKKAHADTPGSGAQATDQETGTDILIRQNVLLALQQERVLKPDVPNVQVRVKEGSVTLTGTASSDANRQRFYTVANAVGSVVRVDNQIVVKAN